MDLPDVGFLTAIFPEKGGTDDLVLSMLNDRCLYTVIIETNVDKLFNQNGIRFTTDLDEIESNRFKVTEIKINEDTDNTMDLKIEYNNKVFWIKVHSCIKTWL